MSIRDNSPSQKRGDLLGLCMELQVPHTTMQRLILPMEGMPEAEKERMAESAISELKAMYGHRAEVALKKVIAEADIPAIQKFSQMEDLNPDGKSTR